MVEKTITDPRDYSWVVNRTKLDRAVKELTVAGKPITEEAVKEIYVRLGGLILENAASEIKEEIQEEIKVKTKRKTW